MNKNSFYISINTKAIEDNVSYLMKKKNKEIIPVIKANAYGHGLDIVLDTLYNIGLKIFAVARLSEALDIIKLNKYQDIKIIVFEDIENLDLVKNSNNIIMTINSLENLKEAIAFGINTEKMSLKIDLGFARNGIDLSLKEEITNIIKYNHYKFFGIFSHLFTADYSFTKKCINDFKDFLLSCGKENFYTIHLQNSSNTFNFDIDFVSHLRVGLLFYGLQEPGYYDENLKQVFSLEGCVDTIKDIRNSKYIAYENKNSLNLNENTKNIAKIKIGYGDGFSKMNENSFCLINNKEYRIIEVSMDASFIEIDERVKVGDKVVLYHYPILCKATTGQYIYEILPSISPFRIPRIKRSLLDEK